MPYDGLQLTSYDELAPNLKELFLKIICAEKPDDMTWGNDIPKIRPVMSEAIDYLLEAKKKDDFLTAMKGKCDSELSEACWDFAEYQLTEIYGGDPDVFRHEGFQIGSPWHGDILNARYIFISSNPNIEKDCIFPRWHPGSNPEFTLSRDRVPTDNSKLKHLWLLLDDNMKLGWDNKTNAEGIYTYLRDRLIKAPLKNGSPCAWKMKNVIIGECERYVVKYWEWLCRFTGSISGKTIPYEIMSDVLSTEIIFWGSKNEDGAKSNPERLKYFWDKFTAPLLKHCENAEVLFIVGGEARDAFNYVMGWKDTEDAISAGEVKRNVTLSGRNFTVAAVDHPRYADIPGNDGRNNAVIDALQA